MGCDIHIHAEVKIAGKWQHYDQPDCDRNYRLFERMAGVRGEVEKAIAPPRGLPEDATDMTRWESDNWVSDGHSHSWLSAQEILDLKRWWDNTISPERLFSARWNQWLCGNEYSHFAEHPADRPKGIEDVRFIFWFDN